MELQFTKDSLTFKIVCPDDTITNKEFFESFYHAVSCFVPTSKPVLFEPEKPAASIHNNSAINIRKRLPNEVDLKEINLKKAGTKEVTFIRCPHCCQSYSAIVCVQDNAYLMRYDEKKKEFIFLTDFENTESNIKGVSRKEKMTKSEYYNEFYKLPALIPASDMTVLMETPIICPVCHETDQAKEWYGAGKSPMDYSEFEHPCHCCGEETVLWKDPKTKQTYYKCEECGHLEPIS